VTSQTAFVSSETASLIGRKYENRKQKITTLEIVIPLIPRSFFIFCSKRLQHYTTTLKEYQ